jgi:hypothetical protein
VRKHLLLVLPAILALLSGCAGHQGEISAALGEEIVLAVGQGASIARDGLEVRFIEVISDSRCPQGATCVWAGEASCLVEISDSESTYRKVLTQPGLSGPFQTSFKEYDITFDLKPYPQVGKEIKSEDYRLQLEINKETR